MRERVLVWLWWMGLMAGLAACESPLSKSNAEGAVITAAGGFLLDGARLRYRLIYYPNQPLAAPVYGRVLFENPRDPGAPLITELGVLNFSDQIIAQSGPFTAIAAGRVYQVDFQIHGSDRYDQLIESHKDQVKLQIPQALLDRLGIELL